MPAVVNVNPDNMTNSLVRNLPVAKFYYRGSHTHPIRRTVLVIESNTNFIKGYEVRCGNEVSEPSDDHIRSYRRSKIARIGDYSRPKVRDDDYASTRGCSE